MSDQCRLYLISPPKIDNLNTFADQMKQAVFATEVACFQLRLKDENNTPCDENNLLKCVDELLPICQDADVAFILNDDPHLAKKCGADGVHLGQSDASIETARQLLGEDASIGVTCHNSMDLAFHAGEAGADYVAFGAFFPTTTKETKFVATLELLSQWRDATVLPSVAIGGITRDNCSRLVAAGADFLAVSSAVWSHVSGAGVAVEEIARAIEVPPHV